jgi:hypothetical protein
VRSHVYSEMLGSSTRKGRRCRELSGGRYAGDVTVPLLGRHRRIECKSRGGQSFGTLYSWLESADLLIIKADRRDALCVLPLRFAVEIARAAEGRT